MISNYKLIHSNIKITYKHYAIHDSRLAIPEKQLKQVLIIIMDNAIKYSGDMKKIRITSNAVKDQYKIAIQDNGYGISSEDLPYIFDRFYRVDKARHRDNGGSGLGLAIAKEIMEEYKGAVHVESEAGIGYYNQFDYSI